MRAKSLYLGPTLRDPVDCSLPDSSVHGILQAKILEWTAIPSSKGPSRPQRSNPRLLSPALVGRFFFFLGKKNGFFFIIITEG